MKVGIMQPYFMPYIGYFQLIKAVDKYVVFDDVNYINRGWINRNNILVGGQKRLFTIELNGASQNKHINEIEIKDDFKKFMKTIQMNYSKAPNYQAVMALLENIIAFHDKQLAKFIKNCIQEILHYLIIDTEIIMSSDIDKDNQLKGKEKIINICKNLQSDFYINAIGGTDMYNKDDFKKNGIQLLFLKTNEISYKQFNHLYVPSLSIIDVLMFNSVDKVNSLLDSYDFI